MKKDIHPENHRMVAFRDTQNGEIYLIKSAIETEETVKVDGKEYPLYEVEVSSSTHPFYTGDQKLMDTAGRAEKFRKRAEKAAAEGAKKKKRSKREEEVEEKVETVIEVESGGKKIKDTPKKKEEKKEEVVSEEKEDQAEEIAETPKEEA
jgi:large subunit ribosomal protein L31